MERIDKMEIDILQCQNEMKQKITELTSKTDALSDRSLEQDKIRKQMNEKLDAIASQTRVYITKFDTHSREEMEKYESIQLQLKSLEDTIKELSDQTKVNTGYIMSYEEDARVDRLVATKLEAERQAQELLDAPKRAMKNKIIMTAIGVVTTVTVGGIISILWFGFKAYMKLHVGE